MHCDERAADVPGRVGHAEGMPEEALVERREIHDEEDHDRAGEETHAGHGAESECELPSDPHRGIPASRNYDI